MKPDDEVVVVRHRGIEGLHSRRYAGQGPAARIYDLRINPEPLSQYPGQHSLPATNVSDVARMREAFGDEFRHDLKSRWVAMTPVTAHLSACADRAVSQPKPVTMLARWNNPARLTSRGDWLKPAPASAVAASMVVAVAALYRPNPRWPARTDCQLQMNAAAGRPRNTGTAARLCIMPVRLGWASASGVPGG